MTEDEMFGWHHRLNGHEFEQAPGDGKGQGSLLCCSPAGVQPRQDPGGTLRMNSVGERRHVRPPLMGPSLQGRERE